MKKTVVFALLICLMASGAVCVRPIKAQSQSIITINADGTVTPSTAPIQQAGNTYTLTSDINGSITVKRSNMTLDGNGQTLQGNEELTISGVSNVTVKNLEVVGTFLAEFGIELSHTSNVTVANNTIMDIRSDLAMNGGGLWTGIRVYGGSSNIITGNNLVNNLMGMDFGNTSNNLIIGNSITGGNPSDYYEPGGILFGYASNNTVYHNNFNIKIGGQAMDSGSVNVWDNGYPFGGNYWSDYQTRYPNAKQINDSGVGDTPYVIDANNTDRYPLMKPFTGAFYTLQTTPPEVTVRSPLNQTYNSSSVPLTFSVDVLSPVKAVNWTGYSLDGEPNVTVTGNTTLTGLSSGLHNITVYANDTYGNIGASPAVTFTVAKPETFPTALVATASGASAAVACLGLLVYFKRRKHQVESFSKKAGT
jgi:parallel beta-helix repeat protein